VLRTNALILSFVLLCLLTPASSIANQCPPEEGVALQVLGSGGPIADDGRASAGYLIWIDGKSRVLIDSGGGIFLRFGEAGADFRDLDFVGLSHFHADHSADFPALLKSGYFSDRTRALIVTGPDSGGPFPGLGDFLRSLLDKDIGAFAYLSGYLDGSGGLPKLAVFEIDSGNVGAVTVLGDAYGALQIDTMHVPHGIVPALAFRVRLDKDTIVFASDQNGNLPEFVDFAKDATILVMHMPVPEGVGGAGRNLHAPPSVIGQIAKKANVNELLLSHFMERSLRQLDKNVTHIRSEYGGPITLATDLGCYLLTETDD
jgi:ribonuclease BN (tRNA processing enzyme)